MGLMTSALHIGRNALLGYQSALQVVGNNISSAGSADYTRLTPQLDPLASVPVGDGIQPGAGVTLSGIRRNIDNALENRVRLAIGDVQATQAEQAALARVESFFDDASGAGVATRLREFFNNFDDLQNSPEDPATRGLVVAGGEALADSLRSLRSSLISLGEDLDGQIASLAVEADDLAAQIAELNARITDAEAGRRGQSTGLRDQRDALLRRLGEIVNVTVREQPNGAINVYIGSEALIQSALSRGLTTVQSIAGGVTRTSVVFADSGASVRPRGGKLAGLIRSRDEHAYGRLAAVDELARAIVTEVNRIHAEGQGLVGYTSIESDGGVLAADVPLNTAEAGLASPPAHGSFYLAVRDDATGTVQAYRIEVNFSGQPGDTTLASLADDINATVTGVTASITADNRLRIVADDGLSFTFGHDGQAFRADSSGILAALGLNTFFSGSGAEDMAVSAALAADPNLVAAATVSAPGDGSNAGRLAELENLATAALNQRSIVDGFGAMATDVAVTAAAANAGVEAAAGIHAALSAQKESISGVSLDEEAIELVKFERAFQSAARYVSTVNDLLDEVMNMVI